MTTEGWSLAGGFASGVACWVAAVALEAESPEVELGFLAPELEGAVSESMIPDWFLGIPLPPGCC